MKLIFYSCILFLIPILIILIVVVIVSTTAETVIIYETKYVDRPIQTTVYVPEPYPVEVPVPYEIEVPIYVDRIVGTPIEYKDWESVNQFIEWYGKQDFATLMPSGVYKVDCDDYAARLQREALKDGYAVSQILLKGTDYYGVKVRDSIKPHDGCMILVRGASGDKFYYVEPDPMNFKVIYITWRD